MTSIKDLWTDVTTFVNRATTWDQARIAQFFSDIRTKGEAIVSGLTTELAYVTGWLTHDGPALIVGAKGLATILAAIPTQATKAAAAAITVAVAAFQQFLDSVTQSSQQGSPAQSFAAVAAFGSTTPQVLQEGARRRAALEAAMSNGWHVLLTA